MTGQTGGGAPRDDRPWGRELFDTRNGELVIGGVPAGMLAERAGGTPFFAYDRRLVSNRVAEVRAALPHGVRIRYAVKANPYPALLHHLATIVDGFDVASSAEMLAALDTGTDPSRIGFAGPGKTAEELRRAAAAGVVVELESASELERLRQVGESLGVEPRAAVRVNPPFVIRGSGMRMGGGPQQFGIDAEEVPQVLREIGRAGVIFEGFHVFAGSQSLDAESIVAAQGATVELMMSLIDHVPAPVRYLNLGGGFGIPYGGRDRPLDLERIGTGLEYLLEGYIRENFPEAQVVIELGRYLVGEAGVYVTRVVERKRSHGKTYLVVDGGLHHQLAASGNFGRAMRRNYPLCVVAAARGEASEEVSVVGCLCTPLDVLGTSVRLPQAEAGDLIAVFQAGAYGLTASPIGFLSHAAPVEMVV